MRTSELPAIFLKGITNKTDFYARCTPLMFLLLNADMEIRIVYVISYRPGQTNEQHALLDKLVKLVDSITVSDMAREILACHPFYEIVAALLKTCEILPSLPKAVIRAAMLTVTVSTYRKEYAVAVVRAHQRLMLRLAHLDDIDLSIST